MHTTIRHTASGALLTVAIAVALGGCAETGESAGWRHAKVVQVTSASPGKGASPGADGRCLGGASGQGGGDLSPTVAVVRYRVTRSFYRQAFEVPAGMSPAIGEAIEVQPDRCEMRLSVARH